MNQIKKEISEKILFKKISDSDLNVHSLIFDEI